MGFYINNENMKLHCEVKFVWLMLKYCLHICYFYVCIAVCRVPSVLLFLVFYCHIVEHWDSSNVAVLGLLMFDSWVLLVMPPP